VDDRNGRWAVPIIKPRLRCRRGGRRRALDDIEVNAAASRAAHGPVFGAGAAVDDAQDAQLAFAIRAMGPHLVR